MKVNRPLMISFYNADIKFSLSAKRVLKQFIEGIFSKEGAELESLTYIFCSDQYLLKINQQFLNHNTYTDIITFDLSSSNSLIGEIYISIERVKDNSKILTIPFEKELLRVIFHGALHLCGYKDKKKSEITIMRQKEDEYLLLFDSHLKQ